MRKIINKIICFTAATVATVGVLTASACSNVYKAKPLDYVSTNDVAVSNGGFAVEKGNYIYFINGKEDYTADNTYGSVVKGAIMRISKTDLKAHNYSSVQTVVPQIAYSGDNTAGIFVYGDYVYYSTPSTEKSSDGEIQSSDLVFKRTKLDGTESMKGYYAISNDNSISYRFVEDNNKVYLLYVATNETLFDETSGVTNIHSVNTETKEDTLLAYNVDSVKFDKTDLTNPRVYYTMKVTDFEIGKTYSTYNQIYTVTAGAERKYTTGAVDYTEYLTNALADEEDGYDPETNPRYVNCGTLVLDGIGGYDKDGNIYATPFNGKDADSVVGTAYTYALSDYQSRNLFYTRTGATDTTTYLFNAKEKDFLASGWNPVTDNPEDSVKDCLSDTSTSTSVFTYLFNDKDELTGMLVNDVSGLVKTAVIDGKISKDDGIDNKNSFYLMTDGQPTVLYVDYENSYLYYSLSKNANGYTANGYTINRIKFDGTKADYNQTIWAEDMNDYDPVCILDLDAANDWYKPEIFEGQILFPTQTKNMTEYVYIMACDIDGLSNAQIDKLNEKYKEITDKIDETDTSVYENLLNALYYAFYTCDSEYIHELRQAYVDIMDYDEHYFWSEESLEKYKQFIETDGDWAEYKDDTVKVNGADVSANKRDYYYALLGVMNEEDAEEYSELLKTTYLKDYPEAEPTWFEELSKGEKAGFIIGVVVGGLLIIAAAIVIPVLVIRKRKEKLPVYTKKRVKVDTTDDKDIDVYNEE